MNGREGPQTVGGQPVPSEIRNISARFNASPVNWWVERVASSKYYAGTSKHEILTKWSLGDIADAHRTLDYKAELEAARAPDTDG